MDNNTWLLTLKVGDKVIVPEESLYGGNQVEPVIKITKTQIHVGEKVRMRFHRESGRSIGTGTWHTRFLQEATPDAVAEIIAKQLKRELKEKVKKALNTFSLVDLQKIVHMFNL